MGRRLKTILTGIKPTGSPHLGNYIGAIKPSLEFSRNNEYNCLYFIADYHALTVIRDAELFKQLCYEVAATWIALGLDHNKAVFYRQSDLPELFELNWILACFTSKGLMNRAHAYKAMVAENLAKGVKDVDSGVNMGLYTYPILMAADILLFKTDLVPVGKDQIQHVEIARDIAEKFNQSFGEVFVLPEYFIREEVMVVPGLDGRKMSKSYNNTIPLFVEEDLLKKLIFKIKTDSSGANEPKDLNSTVFLLYKEFAADEQVEEMKHRFLKGISWGEAKNELFLVINSFLEKPRFIYKELMANKERLDKILLEGAEKAREIAGPYLREIKKAIGRF